MSQLIYYTSGFALTRARGFFIIFGKFQERSSERARARNRSTLFTLLRPCFCNSFKGPKFRWISWGVTMGGYTKSKLMCLRSHSSPLPSLLLTWPVVTPCNCNMHRSLLLYQCQCYWWESRVVRSGIEYRLRNNQYYIKCSSTASTNRRTISIFLLPIRGQKFGHCLPTIQGCD